MIRRAQDRSIPRGHSTAHGVIDRTASEDHSARSMDPTVPAAPLARACALPVNIHATEHLLFMEMTQNEHDGTRRGDKQVRPMRRRHAGRGMDCGRKVKRISARQCGGSAVGRSIEPSVKRRKRDGIFGGCKSRLGRVDRCKPAGEEPSAGGAIHRSSRSSVGEAAASFAIEPRRIVPPMPPS